MFRIQVITLTHPSTQVLEENHTYLNLWWRMRVVDTCTWPRSVEKLSNRALSSISQIRCSSSCFLVASNSSLVLLNSSSVERNRAWVVCSSFCIICNSSWSWMTNGEEYVDEVLQLLRLDLPGLSNMAGPFLPSLYRVPFSLQPPQALKKRWSLVAEPICTSISAFSCSYCSCINRYRTSQISSLCTDFSCLTLNRTISTVLT